jgi:diguanylate cyclase (GGDEF)-like protein/PAS domain S-box-containing protein
VQPSLKAKVIIAVCSIVALVMAINAYIHVRAFQSEFFSAQTQRSRALAQGMIEDVRRLGATMFIDEMAGLLGRHCYELHQLNAREGIADVAVITRAGILVAHSDFNEPLGRAISSSPVLAALSTHEVITIQDDAIFHTLIPIGAQEEKVSAVIDVGWKKASYDNAVHDILTFSIWMFLLSALVVSLIISILLNKVFGQLEVVMKALRDSKTFTQGILDNEKYRNYSLELIASDHPLAFVLKYIVQGIEQLHPQMLCSILLLDKSGEHLVTGAAPSLPAAYNQAIHGIKIGLGVGSCGTAAFANQRVVVDDISTHPYWAPYKELAAQFGLGACWSQPINSAKGQVLGTFAIYHHQASAPSGEDILLIEKTARLASIAIEKDIAASAIRDSEAMYRLLTEGVEELIWRHDAESRFSYLSPVCETLLGYKQEELIGHHFFEILTEEGLEITKQAMAIKQTDLSMPHRRKDGSEVWLDVSVNGEFDESGQLIGLHGIARDATNRRKMEDQVRQLAFCDTLTQLPNRRMLNDRLAQSLALTKRSGLFGAVLFLDLDNFKPLNDQHGHAAGDLLLVEAARRLSSAVREVDTVARLGGDEFVVILNGLNLSLETSVKEATAVAEKIRALLAQPYLLNIERDGKPASAVEHRCTASIGVVLFDDQQLGQNEILKRGDVAMYQAKEAGRNQVRVYPT